MTLSHDEMVVLVVERLKGRVDRNAKVVRGPGTVAVLSAVKDPSTGIQTPFGIANVRGQVGVVSMPDVDFQAVDASDLDGRPMKGLSRMLSGLTRAWGTSEVDGIPEALGEIVAAGDVAAMATFVHTCQIREDVLEWLRSDAPRGRLAQAFAMEHPWLVPHAARLGGEVMDIVPVHGADAAAALVIRESSDDAIPFQAALRVAGGMRWAILNGSVSVAAMRVLAVLPEGIFPVASPATTPRSRLETTSMVLDLAELIAGISEATGRTPRSLVGTPCAAEGYLRHIGVRGLVHRRGNGVNDEVNLLDTAFRGMADMMRAFQEQVVQPAKARLGIAYPVDDPDSDTPQLVDVSVGYPGFEFVNDTADAVRVLVGARTLPALAEVSSRWHARVDGISRLMASLTEGMVGDGPKLFEDLELGDNGMLGDGYYLTCLNTIRDVIDEGAPGPDSNGVDGLDHCVGSYAEGVVKGSIGLVSLRRRLPGGGYERVSTAEIDFIQPVEGDLTNVGLPVVIRQHQGLRNEPPSKEVDAILAYCLAMVGRQAARAAAAFEPGGKHWPDLDEVLARPGAWEAMRDAWSFALTRPLRSSGPAGLLAAAGISVPAGAVA